MTDRFDDDNGMAGVNESALEHFMNAYNHTVDDLPNPEDMVIENELSFIGYFCMIKKYHEYIAGRNGKAAYRNWFITAYALEEEAVLENWLDNARDYIPEWAYDMVIGY